MGGEETRTPSVYLDDLRLIRFAEPPASLEIDPNQDEARLVVGDQIFGEVRGADAERIEMAVEGRPIPLRWSEVSGLYFRRVPAQGTPVEGLLVRAEWQAAAADRSTRARLRRGGARWPSPTIRSRSRRRMPAGSRSRGPTFGGWPSSAGAAGSSLDVSAHHLGDEFSMTQPLDPPQPRA